MTVRSLPFRSPTANVINVVCSRYLAASAQTRSGNAAGAAPGLISQGWCGSTPTPATTEPETRERTASAASRSGNDMAAMRTIEAHPLDSRTDLYCEACGSFTVTAVRCSIVDAATLEHQRYATGSLCLACGAED